MPIRLSLYLHENKSNNKIAIVDENITYDELIKICSQKFNTKIKFLRTDTNSDVKNLDGLTNNMNINCYVNEPKTEAVILEKKPEEPKKEIPCTVYAKFSYIAADAIKQLEALKELPGVTHIAGMPDLHMGKSAPIGATTVTENIIYPHLTDSDIACGISLVETKLHRDKVTNKKTERYGKKLEQETTKEKKEELDKVREVYLNTAIVWGNKNVPVLKKTSFDTDLGTIGRGNHFAEMQIIEKIHDEELAKELGLNKDLCYLAVHSGSRGLGKHILDTHISKHGTKGIDDKSKEFTEYMENHDLAMMWAKKNRALITYKVLDKLDANMEHKCLIDIEHNYLAKKVVDGVTKYIHRKGTSPSDTENGFVLIPGSRGDMSYIVKTNLGALESGFSVCHGAGRYMNRTKALKLMGEKYVNPDELRKTSLDSVVICDNKELLYEEAPEAYKNIECVVDDLLRFGLAKAVATMRPVFTFKNDL